MRISLVNNKFENAFAGSYTLAGNKVVATVDYASLPLVGAKVTMTQRIEGDKLYWSGVVHDSNGKQINQFDDVFQRVNASTTKSIAAQ
jgi:hypothetical protein